MKVGSTRSSSPVAGGVAAGRAHPAGFKAAVSGPAAPAAAAPASGAASVAGVGALLALQEAGGPLERRRRAIKRADGMLDALDEMKAALLDGHMPTAALGRLRQSVRQAREQTDDADLERLLDQVETRAAVEQAKWDMAQAA